MVQKAFSTSWKASTQPRKQRKYRHNAPLHVRQKFMSAHLSADLRKKYGLRSTSVRKGDKVKVLRGSFKGKEGKVERVSLKYEKVYVTGVEMLKKDGSKVPRAIHSSNLMIVDLDIGDKKRKSRLQKEKAQGSAAGTPKKAETKKEQAPTQKEKQETKEKSQ